MPPSWSCSAGSQRDAGWRDGSRRSAPFPGVRGAGDRDRAGAGLAGPQAGPVRLRHLPAGRGGASPTPSASAWDPEDRRIVFITKALGDHTGRLAKSLRVGQSVTVEGPYGCFTFGRCGAAPGLDRRRYRHHPLRCPHEASGAPARRRGAAAPAGRSVPHHPPRSTRLPCPACATTPRAAGVRLHILVDARDGRLTARAHSRGRAGLVRGQLLVLRAQRLRHCVAAGPGRARGAGRAALPPGALRHALGRFATVWTHFGGAAGRAKTARTQTLANRSPFNVLEQSQPT